MYPALLPLMRTPRQPVVDWIDAPADLNGLVRFAERLNLVSARVPSHFKRSLRIESIKIYWSSVEYWIRTICWSSDMMRQWQKLKGLKANWSSGTIERSQCSKTTEPFCNYQHQQQQQLLLLLLLLTAFGLSPGGSSYFTCMQNVKLVNNNLSLEGYMRSM